MENLRESARLGKAARLEVGDLFEAVSRAALREVEGGAALLVDKVQPGGTMGIRPVDIKDILLKGGQTKVPSQV